LSEKNEDPVHANEPYPSVTYLIIAQVSGTSPPINVTGGSHIKLPREFQEG